MSSPSDKALKEFLDLADRWSAGYRRVVRTALAMKVDGNWQLQLGMTFFVSEFLDDLEGIPESVTIETKSILAIREVSEATPGIIEQLVDKTEFQPFMMKIGGYEVNGNPASTTNPSYFFEPMHRRDVPSNWRWPALTAIGKGTQSLLNGPDREALNLELLGNSIPFENLEDLIVELNLPLSAFQSGQSLPQANFIISHPAIIMLDSSIDGNIGRVHVRCHENLDIKNISAGIRAFKANARVHRDFLNSESFKWSKTGQWMDGIAEIELDAHPIASIHLIYNDDFVGSFFIRDPNNSLNHRYLIHKHLHDDRDFSSVILQEKGTHFEDGISLLLSLLGLNCVPYGNIGHFKDGPDIIAHSDRGHLYVIECTVGDVGRDGKLQKLSIRSEEIHNHARQNGMGLQHVLPVMVTSLTWEQTRARWAEAAELGIALVCKEAIENLIRQLETPPSPQQLFEAAVSSIPRKSNQQQLEL